MDLIDRLRSLGERVEKLKDQVNTEEATKNAFVMPFISALGYDVFNPTEVIPEFIWDTKSYFNILLDDNNRKPVCRLWFNRTQKYLGLFDDSKNEERIPIEKLEDIFTYSDRLISTVRLYTGSSAEMATA